MPAVYQPAPHGPVVSYAMSMCNEPPDTVACDGIGQFSTLERYGVSYRFQWSGTPPESNRSLTRLTQPPAGGVVVEGLVVVVEPVVVVGRVVEVGARVVEGGARVAEDGARVVETGAPVAELADVRTMSRGPSSPDSRLVNRSPVLLAVSTVRSTAPAPDTKGVT